MLQFLIKLLANWFYLPNTVFYFVWHLTSVNFGLLPLHCYSVKVALNFDFADFSDYDGWKRRSDRTQLKGTNYAALGKNSANLIGRAPPVQPVHGRVDWAAKYGNHR